MKPIPTYICPVCHRETPHLFRTAADGVGKLPARAVHSCAHCAGITIPESPAEKSFMAHAEDFLACRADTPAGDAANTLSWAVILHRPAGPSAGAR